MLLKYSHFIFVALFYFQLFLLHVLYYTKTPQGDWGKTMMYPGVAAVRGSDESCVLTLQENSQRSMTLESTCHKMNLQVTAVQQTSL